MDDAWAIQREDGSWLLDGAIPIPEMKDCLELKNVPEEDRGRYHTLSGMVMLLLGCVPATGNHVDWSGWRFEVMDMDGKRIDKGTVSARVKNLIDGRRLERCRIARPCSVTGRDIHPVRVMAHQTRLAV
jgi:putative hemolysin